MIFVIAVSRGSRAPGFALTPEKRYGRRYERHRNPRALARYQELAGDNMRYDKTRKAYVPAARFAPVLIRPSARQLAGMNFQNSEDYAPAGRASGGEKLAEWEIKAPRE